MQRRFYLLILLFPFVLGCNENDSGNQLPLNEKYGMVYGKVVTRLSGLPIQSAMVIIDFSPSVSTFTDSIGDFKFSSVTKGAHRLIISKDNFESDTMSIIVPSNDLVVCNTSLTYLVPANDLISYYSFDGNANDLGIGGNNGVVNNLTPTFDRFGNLNKAFFFNGVSSYLNLGTGATLNPKNGMTISAWFLYNGMSNYQQIVSRWDVVDGINERTYAITVMPDKHLSFRISQDGTDGGSIMIYDPTLVSTTGRWIFVTSTWDGTTMRLYTNGNEVATGFISGIRTSANTRTGIGAVLGRDGDSPINYFNGAIDDIRFYNRALTQQEIQTLYTEQ